MNHFFSTVIFLFIVGTALSQWVEQGCDNDDNYGFVNSVSIPQENVIWLGLERSGWVDLQRKASLSTDDGQTWSHSEIDTFSNYACLKVKGIDAQIAYASLIQYPEEEESRIYRTTDGGVTWDYLPSAFNGPNEACIDFHFFDENEGVAFGAPILGPMTIYKTIDGGDTWSKIASGNLPVPLTQEGMLIYSGNGSYGAVSDSIWFGTSKGRIYRSIDRGDNWEAFEIDTTLTIHSVDFKDAQHGVALSIADALAAGNEPNRAFYTSDGGATWTLGSQIPFSPRMGLVKYLEGTPNTYVTTYGWSNSGTGTQISYDGGDTWAALSNERICGTDFLSSTYGWGGGITSTPATGIFKWDLYADIFNLQSDEWSIFPTVVSSTFSIVSPNNQAQKITVLDSNGSIVSFTQYGNQIDVSTLPSGLYFVRNEQGQTKRFIKD